jgi:hypothetical protein
MAKSKTANAIVHSVYMGDGIRLYYEKTDLSVYRGEEASLVRDLYMIAKKTMKLYAMRKWSDVVDYVTKREPTWPPHSLFCDCRKCVRAHSNYKKVMKG